MISVDIAGKAFADTQILGPIKFTVEPGECVALLGPSGIGKTTLLRIICGLDNEFEGEVSRPERLAMVFQEPTLLPWRTAEENLTIINGISASGAGAALAEVGLDGRNDLYPGQLSLGQQRRLALARALSADPEFLVMDEPFASLDPKRAAAMIDLTRDLIRPRGIPALLVTHSEEEAERLATRVLRLEGTPAVLSN